ncbi:hypothetical protein BCR36DRAFT_360700 [Piromyces finnis]|uniref:Uncharacterized protein n=1 Tax=Piromyces finnis TaxID=1754191 RepID=A0A1Y1UYI8_9FUNG|nr:hypothetical protein BCR36DRAFT_360700 [Piromyces finnis]|eukprot:ORX43589.1 hypothetical protein BCR36DRAFT_360700 [Piromyces finnis]
MSGTTNDKIKNFILFINKIHNSINYFNLQLQLLYQYENSILNQIISERKNLNLNSIDTNTRDNKEESNKNDALIENKEEHLHQLIEKSERILNHPYIKSQYKIEELTNKKKKKLDERLNNNNIRENNNNIVNMNKKTKSDLKIKTEKIKCKKVAPEKRKIYISNKITMKYEEHFNKLNSVYETYKNSKLALLEFSNRMSDNEENIDILIDNMDSLLQKYSYISELLMNELPTSNDDTLLNELYSLTEMTDEIENYILINYNNINKTSSTLNKQWKDHLSMIKKESKDLTTNKIYYYQSLSDLLKHAMICFEIQKAELEYSIQSYIKNELIPQLDDDSLSTNEFLQYYKILSCIIQDVNNVNTPIIIKK